MPFEVAPKEPSLADKLAALIEIGRATHPDAKHIRQGWGDGEHTGCAMTFAAMGAGIESTGGKSLLVEVSKALGVMPHELDPLMSSVVSMNDCTTASLDEIVTAIRTNTFPKAEPSFYAVFDELINAKPLKFKPFFKPFTAIVPVNGIIYIGTDWSAESWKPLPVVKKASAKIREPKPLKVRKSARTGATWPVAKGCYA